MGIRHGLRCLQISVCVSALPYRDPACRDGAYCAVHWAEARHTHGTMVFRIEDTDSARDSEESYNQIIEALQWLGIDWDEGVNVGGPHALTASLSVWIFMLMLPKTP